MLIDAKKLNVMLARRTMSARGLLDKAKISPQVLVNIHNGRKLTTKCVGKICTALSCDPTDLLKEE